MEGLIPWRDRMPKKRTPVAERRQEIETSCDQLLLLGVSHNWPDTGPFAWTRKGADVWQVSLCRRTIDTAGTEGQVRHDDGLQFLHP
jgi:hypothetical protein